MNVNAIHIRPFTASAADYAALIAIDSAAWPGEPASLEALEHDDQLWDTQLFWARVMVEVANEIVAYAQYSETPWAYEPNKYFIKIMVHPAFV